MYRFLRAVIVFTRWRNLAAFLTLFAFFGAAWGTALFGNNYLAVALGAALGTFAWAVLLFGPPDEWGAGKNWNCPP